MFHQKLVQDQSKNRLICWQYFTKRLTRQCHHLCSCDCEQFLFNLLYKRGWVFLKIYIYSPSLWSFPLLNSRCCWWSWPGGQTGSEGTPAVAAPCWGSWSKDGGSGWVLQGPGPAGDRSELPPCAAAAEEDALSGFLCRSPGWVCKHLHFRCDYIAFG